MSTKPKQVVDPDPEKGPDTTPTNPKKRFTFVKTRGHARGVVINGFGTVQFSPIHGKKGSVYVTMDAKEAQAIREFARANRGERIFERVSPTETSI